MFLFLTLFDPDLAGIKIKLFSLDIDVAKITEQYVSYIDLMEAFEIELAGDYLVMAAYLAELKSRMLLPRPSDNEEEEESVYLNNNTEEL